MTYYHFTKFLHTFMALTILILASNNIAAMTRLSRVATQSISYIKPSLKKKTTTIFSSPVSGFKPRFIHIDKTYVDKAYDLFDISPPQEISHEQLKARYRKLILAHHPDFNPNNQQEATKKTQEINEAFNFLTQPQFSEREYEEEEYAEESKWDRVDDFIDRNMNVIAPSIVMTAIITLGILLNLPDNKIELEDETEIELEDKIESDDKPELKQKNKKKLLPLTTQSLSNTLEENECSQSKFTKTHDSLARDLIYIATAGIAALILEFAIILKLLRLKKSFPFIMQYLSKDSLILKKCADKNSNLSPEAIDSCTYIENVFASLEKACKDAARGLNNSFVQSLAPFTNYQKIESAINIILSEESEAVKQKELTLIVNAANVIATMTSQPFSHKKNSILSLNQSA